MKLLRFIAPAAAAILLASLWWKVPRTMLSRKGAEARASLPVRETNEIDASNPRLHRVDDFPPERPAVKSARLVEAKRAPRKWLHAKLRELLATKTGDSRSAERLLAELTATLNDANVSDVAGELSPDELHTSFGTAVLNRWLNVDARGAAEWVAARSDATDEQAWLIGKKLLQEPSSLYTFASALPAGDFKQQLLYGAGLKGLKDNPQLAITVATQMDAGALQTNLLETIAFDWATREPDKALNWMTTLPDAQVRERLVAVGAKAIAVTDPDLAVQWLSAAVKTKSLFNETALSVVESWATKNPAQAAAWLTRSSSATVRETAADFVARRWAETDPHAVAVWLADFPEGEKILAGWDAERVQANTPAER